jgi:hypothetical protein
MRRKEMRKRRGKDLRRLVPLARGAHSDSDSISCAQMEAFDTSEKLHWRLDGPAQLAHTRRVYCWNARSMFQRFLGSAVLPQWLH